MTNRSDLTQASHDNTHELPQVLHVIDNLGTGGAQALLVHMASLGGPRLRFSVVSLGRRTSAFSEKLTALGIPIKSVTPRRRIDPRGWIALVRCMIRSGAPIVHLHLATAIIIGAPLAKLLGKKVVVSLHNSREGNPGGRFVQAVEALSLRLFADRILAVGARVRSGYAGPLGRRQIDVFPNVVAPLDFPAPDSRMSLRAALGADERDTVLISTGRFNPLKDHPTMLKGFAQVRERRDDVWLWLVGDGSTRPEVEAEIRRLEIGDRVLVLGQRADVPGLLTASDAFVMTSSSEGLPLGVLEALAAGLPIVATEVGDIPRVVTPDSGILISPGSPAAFAAATLRLCEDAQLRRDLASGALAAGRRYTDVNAWKEALLQVYREVLNGKAPTMQAQPGQ